MSLSSNLTDNILHEFHILGSSHFVLYNYNIVKWNYTEHNEHLNLVFQDSNVLSADKMLRFVAPLFGFVFVRENRDAERAESPSMSTED